MKKKLENLLSILIIMLILPLLVTIFMQKLELESLLDGQNAQAVAQGNTEDKDNNKGQNNSESRDSNQEQNNSESRDSSQEQTDSGAALSEIEQTLPRIVANEINVNAEPEAVRAQCVIARTNCVLAEESGNAMPEALSLDELTRLWGQDKFNEMYQKLENMYRTHKIRYSNMKERPSMQNIMRSAADRRATSPRWSGRGICRIFPAWSARRTSAQKGI